MRLCGQGSAQRLINRLMGIDAFDGHAHLTAVDRGRKEQLLGHSDRVHIVQHDGRIVAAQL